MITSYTQPTLFIVKKNNEIVNYFIDEISATRESPKDSEIWEVEREKNNITKYIRRVKWM